MPQRSFRIAAIRARRSILSAPSAAIAQFEAGIQPNKIKMAPKGYVWRK